MSRSCLLAAFLMLGLAARTAAAQEAADAPEDDTTEEASSSEASSPPAPEAPPRPKVEEPDDDDNGPEPPLVVPALDTQSGHLQLSPSIGYAIPFADLQAGVPQSEAMSAGLALGVDAAYGISRTTAVGLWGQWLSLGAPDSCTDCKTQSTAFGAFVRYHLVQGMRFDPWMSAGLGYRITKITGLGEDLSYSGIEWLRLQVGGDWYAFDKVGFGPYLELDMGRYSNRSPGSIEDGANHWTFLTGARVTLDLPGK